MLDDPLTAQYTHTLTVTSAVMVGEVYTCTVANNKPSVTSVTITVQGIYRYSGTEHHWDEKPA